MVIDASVMLAILLPDEQPKSVGTVIAWMQTQEVIVPVHWYSEVANTLGMALRRGRVDEAYQQAAIARLKLLAISCDLISKNAFFGDTLRLCARHRLSAYDAAYLECAIRLNLPLATLDRALASAALNEGITLVGQPA
ncbi:MAG: type II toxin-antitoxin system VapC family toxin [Rhizobiaceae bacterium]|jgi:predicted nucleic acid-binding protein|nr:type II toxin-antitoxin system VapC family toxin [Rhizobiaceae bacterium]